MKANLTDITLVVDRSGSMAQVKEDAEGGVNTLISEQGKEPGEALLTLVQFDTFGELLFNGVQRVQRRHRFLENKTDVVAAHASQRGLVGADHLFASVFD